MKLSVGWPGRLAAAHSVRTPLRRKDSGIAENTLASISRGGVSRYIIVWFHRAAKNRRTIEDIGDVVDWTRRCVAARQPTAPNPALSIACSESRNGRPPA